MQNTSALYRSIITGDHYFKWKLDVDGAGSFAQNEIAGISTRAAMFDREPEVGKAVSSEIDVKMHDPDAGIQRMACVRPYVRACGMAAKSSAVTITGENLASQYATYSDENVTFDSESGATVSGENVVFPITGHEYAESEWIPQGVYFIDTREVTANNNGLDVLTLHGYDAMLKAEQEYPSSDVSGDNFDTAYVSAIAAAIGVPVDDRTWAIMGGGNIIPFPLGYSMREILGYIAAIYVGCFIITDEGKLRLVSLLELPTETNLLVDSVGDVITFGGDAILI